MPTSIDVVPRGWLGLADANSFYPDDLPPEWQLTYFANAFSAVLLPPEAWLPRSESELGVWRTDVNPGFRFYLEATCSTGERARSSAAAALGSALVAFVDAAAERQVNEAWTTAPGTLLAAHGGQRIGVSVSCPRHLNGDPRGARAWLTAQPEQPRLVILDRPRSTELEAWGDLLMLLGLS